MVKKKILELWLTEWCHDFFVVVPLPSNSFVVERRSFRSQQRWWCHDKKSRGTTPATYTAAADWERSTKSGCWLSLAEIKVGAIGHSMPMAGSFQRKPRSAPGAYLADTW